MSHSHAPLSSPLSPPLPLKQFLVEDGSAKLQESFDASVIYRVRPAAPASLGITNFRQLKVRGDAAGISFNLGRQQRG